MADNYKLSVTIEALDKFTPIMKKVSGLMGTSQKDIDKTTKSFKGLGNSSQDVDKLNKSLKEMQNYENGIKRLNDGFTTFKSTLLDLGLVAASSKALKELFGLAKEAGNIQMKNIELGGIYGLNETSKQLQDINKQANELSNMTLFSTKDILAINTELGHAQVNIQNLAKVVPQATYLAEVEVGIGKSGSPTQSAYNFARMAEDSGITSDTD
ncbi:MAG: phage tail tape measure protein, partial [Bacilli bacterium]|nr:phage tail tape measure protein [Bacilli bacterium]